MLAANSNLLGNTIVYVVGAGVVGGVGYWFKHRNDAKDRQLSIDDSAQKRQALTGDMVHAIYNELVTATPTPLNPHPEPKLIDRVAEVHASVSQREAVEGDLFVKFNELSKTMKGVIQTTKDRMKLGDSMMSEFATLKDNQRVTNANVDTVAKQITSLATANTKMVSVFDARSRDISTIVKRVVELDKKVAKLLPDGGESNDPGDLVLRAAKANGTWNEDEGEE